MNISTYLPSHINPIIKNIIAHGGKPYLVGGVVRDMMMNLPIKDIDIEVHGLSEKELEAILSEYGFVMDVGKSFGVLRVAGLDIDWSLPRKDSAGRKPVVVIDPTMSIETALSRRDLTMNAMAIDLTTNALVDPFNGSSDIKAKVLRPVNAQVFVEDPLRFYRVMQFVSRFEMNPDDELDRVCSAIVLEGVSRERIEQEFKKMLLLSKKPSLGIRWMNSIGRLKDVLPELAEMIFVEQNPQWHPEGSVFEHLLQALDAAAHIMQGRDDRQRLIILYAALCHDLGKKEASRVIDGVIRSFGHEKEVKRVKSMLRRITHDGELIDAVVSLIENHMVPMQLVKQGSSLAAYKRLANRLSKTVSMELLSFLFEADKRGRNGISSDPLPGPNPEVLLFVEQAKKAGVFKDKEAPVLTGADIMDHVKPGPAMGLMLKKAYKIQIDRGIRDKKALLEAVLNGIE